MSRGPILVLRVLLALIFAGLVLTQVVILPLLANESALLFPEIAYLKVPMLIPAIGVLVAIEVIIVCIWVLLGLVAGDRLFAESAYRWVDVIVGSALVIASVLGGSLVYLGFGIQALPPVLNLALIAGVLAGLGLATLMLVMKGLLRQAHGYRTELDLVV